MLYYHKYLKVILIISFKISFTKIRHTFKNLNNFYNIMSKYSCAYILSHNGLGDNITMIGAMRFLLQYYENIYLLCKDKYESNVKLLVSGSGNIFTVPFDHENEFSSCEKIINKIYNDVSTDIFICGVHKRYLQSKINNPMILNYKKSDSYDIKWQHIKLFYDDMKLDLSVYYNFFAINSSYNSVKIYKYIEHLHIIFCHTQSSTNKIGIPEYIKEYINDNNYIIICANENIYNNTHIYFEIANKYVNIQIQEYIDIIKNACEIFVIDSCFSSMINPLIYLKKLKTEKITFQSRH